MKVFYINLVISIALIVGGFFVPPVGIIDGSVLTAVGELLLFTIVAQVPKIMQSLNGGKSIRLSKGDFTIEASAEEGA
ncbi:MAG: hypothetical protein MJZ73_03230 [Bacteroidaceae bacterium]|nr:hypothetical protein [Bacteroidaceae bacterium]